MKAKYPTRPISITSARSVLCQADKDQRRTSILSLIVEVNDSLVVHLEVYVNLLNWTKGELVLVDHLVGQLQAVCYEAVLMRWHVFLAFGKAL